MAASLRVAAALTVAVLAGCAASSFSTQPAQNAGANVCGGRVISVMAFNERAIRRREYAAASRTAESAARLSLQCGDRWRAANALKVAAELAHQQGNTVRAHALLHESFTMMRGLHATQQWSDVTKALLAERLSSAQKEMNGQWVYW